MNHVFSRWNALCLAAGLLLVWPGRVEAYRYGLVRIHNDGVVSHSYNLQFKTSFDGVNYQPGQTSLTGSIAAGGYVDRTVATDGSNSAIGIRNTWDATGVFDNYGAFNPPDLSSPGTTIILEIYYSGPMVTCKRTIPITNNTLQIRRGYWTLDGVAVYVEDIAPGETKTHTVEPTNCASYTVSAYDVALMLNDDFELVPSTNLWDNVSNESGDSTNAVTLSWKPPLTIDAGGALDSTNGSAPISFSGAAATNSSRAIQEGFTATLLSQQQADEKALQLLNAIRENTGATATNVTAVNSTLTNIQSLLTTNVSEIFVDNLIDEHTAWISEFIGGKAAAATTAVAEANSAALDYAGEGVNDFASGMSLGGEAIPMSITISQPTLGSYTMDLNPAHVGWLATVMSMIRAAFSWFVVFWTFRKNFEAILATYRAVNQVTPYSVGGEEEILGNNISLPWRIVMGFIIIALVATIPALWVTWADKSAAFGGSPFAGFSVSPVMSTALHLADMVIPVGAIFAGLVGHWTLRTLVLIPAEIFGSSVRGFLAGL